MTIHRVYRKGDPEKIGQLAGRNHAIAVADPGAAGVVLLWVDGLTRWPRPPDVRRTIGSNGSGHRQVVEVCERYAVRTFICEDQFLGSGKGATAMISLVRSAGMLVGAVQYGSLIKEVVWLPPWAWQKRLPKHRDSKLRSQLHADRLFPGWLAQQGTSPQQEACADVVGMMAFYEEITRVQNHTPSDVRGLGF